VEVFLEKNNRPQLTKMSNKKFDRELYEKYDALGKSTVKHFMKQLGYKLLSEEEAYKSHDLIFEKDGDEIKVEIQVCRSWETLQFPYATLNMPLRKKSTTSDIFITVNRNGSALLTIPMEKILASPIITKDTCFTRGEKFFNTPQSLARQFFNSDGEWLNLEDDTLAINL
jgi:hypothetical protein